MEKKSNLLKILGIFFLASAMTVYPSMSFDNFSQYSPRIVRKKIIPLEKRLIEKAYTEDMLKVTETTEPEDTEPLLDKIKRMKLNTGEFGAKEIVELLDKGIKKAGGLPSYMDEKFLYCLVNRESSWNPWAESEMGAKGPAQITLETWLTYNSHISYEEEAFNPVENIKTAVKTLKGHKKYFEENHPDWENLSKEEKLKIHLAAYNWGEGNLKKIGWDLEKEIPKETRELIERVLGDYYSLSKSSGETYQSASSQVPSSSGVP